VVYLVGEPDGRGFVRIGFSQFDPDLPHATLVKTCRKNKKNPGNN
jgi:hypothetical protein